MSHRKLVPAGILLTGFVGCASARPPSLEMTGPPSSPEAVEQVCAGVSEDQRNASMCLGSDDILRVERIPVEVRGGDVLTGVRMVFRTAPNTTAESFQQVVNCHVARNSLERIQQSYPQIGYCPLRIKGVKASVQPVADGMAVEVRPTNAVSSRRISHTLAHGTAAVLLARFESTECRGIEPKARAACPLLGPVTVITDLPQGARVEFAPSVSLDGVLAGMHCHYSFAQARGFSEEATACPLYMRGLRLERSADGRAIDITITPAAMVNEVRKRIREEAVFAGQAESQQQ